MKLDIVYGFFGFQDKWLKAQGIDQPGGRKRNIAAMLGEAAQAKDLDAIAVLSHDKRLEPRNVHDRFDYMFNAPAREGAKEESWHVDFLGENIAVLQKEGKPVYVINAQVVVMNEEGYRRDHIVLGSNRVPQGEGIEDTLSWGNDQGLIQIANSPSAKLKFPLTEMEFGVHQRSYDAIVGHHAKHRANGFMAQGAAALSKNLGRVFTSLSKESDVSAQNLAGATGVPWIGMSGAQYPVEIGAAYTEFGEGVVDTSTGERFLATLKKGIGDRNFRVKKGHVGFWQWVKGMRTFDKHKE